MRFKFNYLMTKFFTRIIHIEHYKKINSVLLGVGGAFPVYAEHVSRAPKWMSNNSLEWLYRLIKEPKRMWKRYLFTNTVFLMLLIKRLIIK